MKYFRYFIRTGIPADVSDERLKNLSSLKENVTSSEATDLFSVVNELATVCLIFIDHKLSFITKPVANLLYIEREPYIIQ